LDLLDTAQAYQILQLPYDASFSDVKYKYRKMALESHPDKTRGQDSTKFKMVTEAYHLLKNNTKASNAKMTQSGHADRARKAGNTSWGTKANDRTPSEDWSRFTKDVEESDPSFWKSYVAEFWKNYEQRVEQAKSRYDFEINRDAEPDLSVDVDHSLCIGCCSCETIAPSVFSVDKISKLNPKSRVINKKGDRCEKILDAAQTCPTKAIKVEDEKTRRRLYPY
jgi:ferredoxin